ncbi:MAG: molybdopterin cofactor-binding domain-containing protein [Pseudomonadales bacterium]
MSEFSVIGKNVPRPDAVDKVTGGRGFPVNVQLPGMLHAKLLRSPYPHARVLSIDTSAAAALPGVKAVLVPEEVPNIKYSTVFFMPTFAKSMVQDMLILSDTVRYVGQPIAAVAATTPEIAEQAAALIDVEFEELPAIFDPEQAMQDGAPQLHRDTPNNIAKCPVISMGDMDAGFAEADYIFEGVYATQRVHTCYMEPKVCVADWHVDGQLIMHSSMQQIYGLREKLADCLGIPEGQVTVVKPTYIGGGFGGKLDISYIEPIAALLSKKVGKPVRIEHTRAEDFISTARHPIKVYLKTGVKKDGTFSARYAKSILDTGAHCQHGAEVLMVHGMAGIMFSYGCENRTWEGYAVYTNNMVGGGYRGYGGPQGCFAVESQIDEICDKLSWDPIEFRLKNTHQEGDPHPMLQDRLTLDTFRLDECLRAGAERIGWSKDVKPGSDHGVKKHGVKKRGIGFACHPFWVSGCVGFPDIYEHSGAMVKFNRDGSVDLNTAAVDLGGGQTIVFSQIVAEELSIPVDKVRIGYADTSTVPFDAPIHASRGTYSSGGAIKAAAAKAKTRLLEIAGSMLDKQPEDLHVRDGQIFLQGSNTASLTIEQVIANAESPFIQMTDEGPVATNLANKGTILGVSSMAPSANPCPTAAQFVEVEVDTETGEVNIERVVYAHDIGRVINPMAAEGQVEGGFQQGMGYALMEHIQFDPDTGSCLSGDFLDYKMPTAVEMPRKIESIFIESVEPSGPFGAKGLSELCLLLPAPAIANAVYHATGARVRDLPITPEKVLAALGKL